VFTHERHEVGLGSLLESHHGRRLEAEVGLEVLGDLTDETLERELADEELGGPGGRGVRSNSNHQKGFLGSGGRRCRRCHSLLVSADLTESDGTGPVSVRLLDTAGGGGSGPLLGGLGGDWYGGQSQVGSR
jgi:hypothetical protein